ncbi:MAG: fumarate hydratase [Desulfurivibrionaceae bacterium]|jgi:fumarate hydratase subunit alpha|nr:fumarate hydratase [Pseudomonadota bacterium]MCG2822730.1 fumarate hydratase [Desulfobulbaceae bacterium]MDP2003767.1 fumarate hydratase [Desulfurivibrionaceae bacterium]MDP2757750.1 fumarate hydratase [Desulfurivibrionaceae bacterium]PKN21219.1 MAG: fumarate hydratase [Deltaproteobacteria bacterium HGW-Deltaproteobacteria-3]
MREIDSSVIRQVVRDLAIAAAHDLEPDILEALLVARDRETGELAGNILEVLVTNANIASRDRIPVCQDTGTGILFLEIGQEVHIRGDLQEALQEGVRLGYEEGYLRKSVCDPLTRKNTGTNTPAVVHMELVPGDRITIRFLPKGCGSENMSSLVMLPPAAGTEGVVGHVIDRVLAAGSNPCPPMIVGVGLGGSFEKAALLAKKALLRPVGEKNRREDVAVLEERLLREINAQGQGVHGFGGITTALAVHMEVFPCHIASLPVGINIQCHAHRHKEIVL